MNARLTLLLGGLVASSALAAQATPATTLLALSKSDRSLAIVDPSSLKIIARVPVGPDPHEVVASADGRFAYVSNYGGGTYNTITPVDLVGQKALPPIDLGALRGPHGLDVAGGKVWFTSEIAQAIGRYDPAAGKIDWILGTGQSRTHMIFVFDAQQRIATSNVSAATISIIELASAGRGGPGGPPQSEWRQTVIPVGRGAEGFDVTRDGKELWAANAQDGTISIIDVANKKVVQTLAADVAGANRLKFIPSGAYALVSSLQSADVTVIDVASRKVVRRIPVGHGAAGIQMQPDGSRAYVACSPDGYIAIIDLKTLAVTGHLDVGKDPDGLAWAVRR